MTVSHLTQVRPIAGEALSEQFVERILTRLGFNRHPAPTSDGLRDLYSAWCERIPFDNIRKLIHVRSANSAPLPGTTPEDFFEAWLKFGTGGTCWPGAGALHALLTTLGFDAVRGIGTMMAAPNLPPNHGTVLVKFDGHMVLVDSSILHGHPLTLSQDSETSVSHPAWGVRCVWRETNWFVQWRPLMRLEGFDCRLDRFPATETDFKDSYARTRGWSPFNYELSVRANRGDKVLGVASGHAISLLADGSIVRTPLTPDERRRFLIEVIGITEALVLQLPDDVPTPPPPWSQTAQSLAESSQAAQNVQHSV
jgi:N-hydroxyarylamine O-acetyltransferase